MYIQITTKCNMRCGHCCFSCEPGKGENMSLRTYRAALKMARDYDSCITLGGGEPTLHPAFTTFLLEAIAATSDEYVPLVITNGKLTATALMLARLWKKGVVQALLSVDEFHERVAAEVYEAFGDQTRRVTSYGRRPILAGRYREHAGDPHRDEEIRDDCCCDDLFVTPSGDVRQCGCDDAPVIGNVFDGILDRHSGSLGTCCHSKEYFDGLADYQRCLTPLGGDITETGGEEIENCLSLKM